jgi:hypothetical protein
MSLRPCKFVLVHQGLSCLDTKRWQTELHSSNSTYKCMFWFWNSDYIWRIWEKNAFIISRSWGLFYACVCLWVHDICMVIWCRAQSSLSLWSLNYSHVLQDRCYPEQSKTWNRSPQRCDRNHERRRRPKCIVRTWSTNWVRSVLMKCPQEDFQWSFHQSPFLTRKYSCPRHFVMNNFITKTWVLDKLSKMLSSFTDTIRMINTVLHRRLSCGCPCAATSVRGKSENIWKTWKVSLLISCPPQRPDHCIKASSWTQCDSKTSRSSPETRSRVIGEVLVSCNFISSCMNRVNSLHMRKNFFDSPCRERVETSGELKLNYQIISGKFFKGIMGPIFQFLILIFPERSR